MENPAARLNKNELRMQKLTLKPSESKPEGEGGTDSEPVGKIVNSVADDDHQTGAWHGAASAAGGGNPRASQRFDTRQALVAPNSAVSVEAANQRISVVKLHKQVEAEGS